MLKICLISATLLLSGTLSAATFEGEPPSLSKLKNITEYKSEYIEFSSDIIQRRTKLLDSKHHKLKTILTHSEEERSIAEKDFAKALAEDYAVKEGDITLLTKRVDSLPTGLLVAMMIHKTTWGTNEVLVKKNNPFGIKDIKGDYKSYNSIDNGIRAFLFLVNTSPDYTSMRIERDKIKSSGSNVETVSLVDFFAEGAERESLLNLIAKERLYYLD
jgi:uncharacterized FlgJ-related protein